MECTLEISMYPLDQAYVDHVLAFLDRLRKHENIRIETNGMSTQIFGDYDHVMQVITEEMKTSLDTRKAIFVMKVAQGTLRYDGA